MKSKFRIFPVIIIALACCLMTACFKTYYWKVAQSVENISKIEIFDNYGREDQAFICEISPADYAEIVNDIQAMPAKKYMGDPTHPYGKVIKIMFIDGTYDEISKYEPRHITDPDEGYSNSKISWLSYKEKDYNQLIEKWIAKY